MLRFLLGIAIAGVFLVSSECGVITSRTCSERYQAALNTAVEIQDKCESAAIYDCCQAKTVFPQLPTDIYEIADVCDNEPFGKSFARCGMDSEGGGWIVIQRRVPGGSENFERLWEDYEDGFGDLDGEFWYGLRNIHCITSRDDVELRIELRDEDGNSKNWTYQVFQVAGAADKYRLTIGGASGTSGGDGMAYSNGWQFSTSDNDNDGFNNGNCAANNRGAWWLNSCYRANLNGPHLAPPPGSHFNQIIWIDPPGISRYTYYPSVEMKVRPKSCFVGIKFVRA